MKIGGIDFGRVAMLVLDYDPQKENDPFGSVMFAYRWLGEKMIKQHIFPSGLGRDVTVLANEELIAKHQKDLERSGIIFFPDWRAPRSPYRELLREGLRQGDKIYLMVEGYGNFKKVTTDDLEIIDLEGKLDIKPKHPLYS